MKSTRLVTSALGLIVTLAPCSYGQRFATLYTIAGDDPGGLATAKGVLYGTTFPSGLTGSDCGTVYELQPPAAKGGAWVGTVLYTFPLGGACSPDGAPVVGADGSLYGRAFAGGAYLFGALYELQPPSSAGSPWTESTLYNFNTPGTDIGYAVSGLVKGPNGSFYVLVSGGAYGASALCQLQPPTSPGGTWTATLLYSFPAGQADGPVNSLTAGPDGVLYGTMQYGGNARAPIGEVFQLTPPAAPGGAWSRAVLHSFGGADDDVGDPFALTVAPDGAIYGAAYGSTFLQGASASAAFRLTPPASPAEPWTYAVLADLGYNNHVDTPLVLLNGNLYGAFTTGATGAIFELQPPSAPGGTWTIRSLHTFTNGQAPIGNLVVGPNGTIFGTTAATPGQPSGGTVYAITTQ